MAFEIGRVCVKLAGRDAGKKCAVIDIVDDRHVMIDGETRRRKCNIAHLEPTLKTVQLSQKASHDDVLAALDVTVNKGKPKKAGPRPLHKRKVALKPAKPAIKTPAK